LISELWRLYEVDKRIQGFSPETLKAYALQLKMLISGLGDLEISEVTLILLKEYLAKHSDRLKPNSLGYRIRSCKGRQYCWSPTEWRSLGGALASWSWSKAESPKTVHKSN